MSKTFMCLTCAARFEEMEDLERHEVRAHGPSETERLLEGSLAIEHLKKQEKAMGLTISQMAKDAHELSRSKGWWDQPADQPFVPEKLMLIVSEASEALESYRKKEPLSFYVCPKCAISPETVSVENFKCTTCGASPKPEGMASELADILIRCGDLAVRLGIDLERAVREKHAYNQTRSQRHGGKVC